jgi:hypothetical protein
MLPLAYFFLNVRKEAMNHNYEVFQVTGPVEEEHGWDVENCIFTNKDVLAVAALAEEINNIALYLFSTILRWQVLDEMA